MSESKKKSISKKVVSDSNDCREVVDFNDLFNDEMMGAMTLGEATNGGLEKILKKNKPKDDENKVKARNKNRKVSEDDNQSKSEGALTGEKKIRIVRQDTMRRWRFRLRTRNGKEGEDKYKLDKWYCVKNSGYARIITVPEDFEAKLDCVQSSFPHFSEVVNFLRKTLMVKRYGVGHMCWNRPILLDGPAGIGKTTFVHALAEILGLPFRKISLSSASNAFDLTGLSNGFNTGKPGIITDLVLNNGFANPLVMLDEIEKTARKDTHDPSRALYDLLEPSNSRNFVDEYLELSFDASHVNYIATSNERNKLDTPILDRMEVIEVRSPTIDEMVVMFISGFNDFLINEKLTERVGSLTLDRHAQCLRDNMKVRGSGSLRFFNRIFNELVYVALKHLESRGALDMVEVSNDMVVKAFESIELNKSINEKKLSTIGFIQ